MFILILVIFFLFSPPVQAVNEFTISQNVSYTVSPQGKTNVHQQINLTNNLSQIYAKEYKVDLFGSSISNITGHDSSGNIIDRIETKNDQTSISLKFNQPVIGKNQTNQFAIDYVINDFAKKKGNTWEIQFPIFTTTNDQQINLSLSVPVSFGDLSFSSIPVSNLHNLNNTTEISFSPSQIKDSKILLVFGNHQLFDFKLSYFLQNTQSQNINTEIALPPDTDSQNIVFQSIEPRPSVIKTDSDGNWLAQYSLSANQSLEISVSGQAKIHPPLPTSETSPTDVYLQPQKFWPITDPEITAIAQTLNNPRDIYRFVVNTLSYNYSQIDSATRRGADNALKFPDQSLCTEFTDLFVTLSRAKSIPAREIEGYAYSNNTKIKPTNINSDVLHAWPEYFDIAKKRWIQVDPTWEKTTNGIDYFNDLDLNHLTFVIHGLQSDYPSPPGSLKKDPTAKSVFVDFASEENYSDFISPEISIHQSQLVIKNPNLSSLHHLQLNLQNSSYHQSIDFLPPLGIISLNVPKTSFFNSLLPSSEKYHFNLQFQEKSDPISYHLVNQKHFLNLSICIGITIFILCLGGIILTIFHQHHEKNS